MRPIIPSPAAWASGMPAICLAALLVLGIGPLCGSRSLAEEKKPTMPTYTVRRTPEPPSLKGDWDGPIWRQAETGTLDHFVPTSSDHRPKVQFRLLYDAEWIYVLFRVEDRYVRCVETKFNGSVCQDSCTEFFVQPRPDKGYFNFEVNCGGNMLCYYIEDPSPSPQGEFAKYTPLTPEQGAQVRRYHSLPAVVDPEITEPVTWLNEIHIPLALLETFTGPLGDPAGQEWRANLYKCGDKTSHPHWATWAPIEGGSFHQPHFFAPLRFAAQE